MVFLQTKGFEVVGCEAVEKPCIDFFTENAIDFEKKVFNDDFTIFQGKSVPIRIVCGDYFKLTPEVLGDKMDCVFDRGSIVAIDKGLREK